jgi:hypothetical protein
MVVDCGWESFHAMVGFPLQLIQHAVTVMVSMAGMKNGYTLGIRLAASGIEKSGKNIFMGVLRTDDGFSSKITGIISICIRLEKPKAALRAGLSLLKLERLIRFTGKYIPLAVMLSSSRWTKLAPTPASIRICSFPNSQISQLRRIHVRASPMLKPQIGAVTMEWVTIVLVM